MKNDKRLKEVIKNVSSHLAKAVEATPDVCDGYRKGLQALDATYSEKIKVPNTRLLEGSLDIDSSTEVKYPTANRWDYAIEYDNEVFFLEFHPCMTSEVATVLNKLDWLNKWLRNNAPEIDRIKSSSRAVYHWIATKDFSILKTSRQYKVLSQRGLIPKAVWDYSKLVEKL